jgi:hypothetical protein
MNNNNENIFVGTLGAIISNIASINGLDIVQSILISFAGGFISVLGKDLYKKLKEK